MFKISAGVGFGQANNPADVAFVQMALKVAKKGVNRNNKTPYWTRRIDGTYTYHLASAIARYKEAHFSEKELRMPDLLNESIEAVGSYSSKSYKRLVQVIPSSYRTAVFGFGKIRDRTVIYLKNTNKRGLANYRVEDISLPNDLAKALLRYLDQLFQGYSVIPTIEIITVDNDGRFNVRIGVNGGRIIDAETGKIASVSEYTKSDAVSLFRLSVNNSNMPFKRLWQFTGQREIIFTSRKQYDFLKPSGGSKAWQLWQLGSHKTRHQSQVVERALDAYDRFRLGANLRPETERFMIEVFGDDWAQIKNKQQIKEQQADAFRRKVKDIQNTIKLRKSRLLFLENRLRENLGIERTDILGNLARDLLVEKIKKGRKKFNSNSSKGANTTKNERKANETISGATDDFVDLTISTISDPPEDITEVILFGLSAVSFALLAFGAGLVLAGVGAAGAVISAGLFIGRANEFISGAIDVYDAVSDVLKNQKLDEELKYLESEVAPAQNALADAIESLKIVMMAVKAEGIVSMADFSFSQQELDQGLMQLKQLKLV